MYSVEKVSLKNQQLISGLMHIYNLSLRPIIEKYGIRFTLKLLRSVNSNCKETRYQDSVYLVEPKEIGILRDQLREVWRNEPKDLALEAKLGKEIEEKRDAYIDLLIDAGFKFNFWKEDMIDEDSGEFVSIPRVNIFKLVPKENPA